MISKLFIIAWLVILLVSCVPATSAIPKGTVISPERQTSIPSTPKVTQTPALVAQTSNWKTLTSDAFHITLKYPVEWDMVHTGEYSGKDGFLRISACSLCGSSAKAACENEIQNNQNTEKPVNHYGTNPTMETLQVDNQPACLVSPSDDQPKAEQGLSFLAVEYPASVRANALLFLFADKNHIRNFISTLKFIH